MRSSLRHLGALLFTAMAATTMAQEVALTPGQAIEVSLPADSFSTAYFVDVAPSAQQLIVTFDGPANSDVDLLLRFGSAFPTLTLEGLPPLFGEQLEYAHYASISAGPNERIAISRAHRVPVQSGRWHFLLVNFSNQPITASLRVDVSEQPPGAPVIEVVYDDPSCPAGTHAFWFDNGPRQNSTSNSGQTIGEQRRIAMDRASELIAAELRSAVPIRIAACWNDLGTGNAVTLAQAGPRQIFRGLKSFPENHTWYSGPAAMRLAGAQGCASVASVPCTEADIGITFNTKIDTNEALGNNRWQYALTPQEFTDTFGPNFISVAMHEIAHGLGFLSLVNANPENNRPLGEKFNGFDDAYSRHLVIQQADGSFMRYLDGSNAERAAALTSQTRLQWDEPAAVNSIFNLLRPNNVRIFAPPELKPGSTQSHIDQSSYGQELMRPSSTQFTQQTLGLARFMLHAVGWSPAERSDSGFAEAPSNLYFDPRRAGHGVDFRRVLGDVYFMVLYTFDDDGLPEWYIAIGEVVDGQFLPAENAAGSSLVRFRYEPSGNPPQTPDTNFQGMVRADFNGAAAHPACQDGFPGRSLEGPLALMQFAINANSLTWCMEPLLPDTIRPTPDLGGTWFADESDAGWGFSVGQFLTPQGTGLFVALYYPDAEGHPRWALAQTSTFASSATEPLLQVSGYCRTCEAPEGGLVLTQVGTIALSLVEASTVPVAGNLVELTVTYAGPEGGTFTRTVPIQLLSAPEG